MRRCARRPPALCDLWVGRGSTAVTAGAACVAEAAGGGGESEIGKKCGGKGEAASGACVGGGGGACRMHRFLFRPLE